MPGVSAEVWLRAIEKSIYHEFPGIRKVSVIAGGECRPAYDARASELVAQVRPLNVDEMLIKSATGNLVLVKDDYEDIYVIIYCRPDANTAMISRSVRLIFSRSADIPAVTGTFMPAPAIEHSIKRWKRSIGLVFGKEFADRLISSAMNGKNIGSMTQDDLGRVRDSISYAIGGCMELPLSCNTREST